MGAASLDLLLRPAWAQGGPLRERGYALGTQVELTLLHDDPTQGRRAARAAFAELERIESLMSIYRPQSALSRLNREGFLEAPDPDLVGVLACAQRFARASEI